MPGGLSLQQDEGVEEPLARVLRGGRVGTVPGDRGGPQDKDRRGIRGGLRRYPGHAAWALGDIGCAKVALMEASQTGKDTWCTKESALALTGAATQATVG